MQKIQVYIQESLVKRCEALLEAGMASTLDDVYRIAMTRGTARLEALREARRNASAEPTTMFDFLEMTPAAAQWVGWLAGRLGKAAVVRGQIAPSLVDDFDAGATAAPNVVCCRPALVSEAQARRVRRRILART